MMHWTQVRKLIASATHAGTAMIIAAFAFSALSTANAADLAVPSTDYPTIQSAVDAAVAAEDTVVVGSGTFAENVMINKQLTLRGAGAATVIEGISLSGNGITIGNGVHNVVIEDLTVQNFIHGSGVRGMGNNNGLLVQRVVADNNGATNDSGKGGIYVSGPIDGLRVIDSHATNNGSRGIVVWDNVKKNITITGNTVSGNRCCGIELQDGTASGVNVSHNIITGNADNGIGLTGLTSGAGPNIIAHNTVSGGGRFGIEIKLPHGTGSEDELADGTIVVRDNTVSFAAAHVDLRDRAGIAVFRRGWTPLSADIPHGVVVKNNTVSGFVQSSTSEGFGIVIEGLGMLVKDNSLSGNDVDLQFQSGYLPYVANTAADGNQDNAADEYFGRGNSPVACVVDGGNGVTPRVTGVNGTPVVTNTTTGARYCSIASAIAYARAGETIDLDQASHTYEETVTIDKSVTLKSSIGATLKASSASTGASVITVTAPNVTIEGITIDVNRPYASHGITSFANNVTVLNNTVMMTGASAAWPRIGIALTGANNEYTVSGNTIYGATSDMPFEGRGIWVSATHGVLGGESGADANTILAWFDVLMQFSSGGDTLVKNNTFKGGGLDIAEPNQKVTALENTFAPINALFPHSLVVKNSTTPVEVTHNTFTNHKVALRLSNSTHVTVESNEFTADETLTEFSHIVVSNKVLVSSFIASRAIAADIIKNTFHASNGGTAIVFQNHNAAGATYGTLNVGAAVGKGNTFSSDLTHYIVLDDKTYADSTDSAVVAIYPEYSHLNPYTTGPTQIAPFAGNITATYNNFGDSEDLALIETKITHQPDNADLGLVTFSALSSNANLEALTVDSGTLMPAFAPATTLYSVELPADFSGAPVVSATADDADATMTIVQSTTPSGTASVTVTAPNGATKVYMINFSVATPPVTPTTPTVTFGGSGGGFSSSPTTFLPGNSTNPATSGSGVTVGSGGGTGENGGVTLINVEDETEQLVEFTDINNHWGEAYIRALAGKCRLTGFTDENGLPLGLFGPNYTITRAEVAQMLAKCDGRPLLPIMNAPFSDVMNSAWFAPAVARMKEMGWIEGYPDGTFRPDTLINRAEALTVILRSMYADEKIRGLSTRFSDVSLEDWYGRFVSFAESKGFIEGYKTSDGTLTLLFGPANELTRAEAAKLIVLIKGYME